jgi:PAS domain S-box-containing protein
VGKRTKGSSISKDGRPDNTSGSRSVESTQVENADLRTLLDSLTTQVAYIDTDKRLKYANPAYCERLGIAPEDIVGRPLRDVIGASAFAAIEPEIERALTGESVSFERLVPDGNGTFRYVRASYTPETDANGMVKGFFAMIVDATDQFETEKALKASEDRYRAFISQSSEGIWRIELETPISTDLPISEQVNLAFRYGYLAECNDVMARQYAFESSDDLVGARLGQLLLEDDPNNIEFLRTFIRSGYRLNDAESHELDANGHDRYFLNNFVGIIEDGKLLRAWGSQRDVTQTKTEELARSRLAAIVESSEDGIIGLDLERRITSWNKAAERIYGYTAEEILGKPIDEVIPEERSAQEDQIFARVAAGENVNHYETTRRSRDGRLVDVSLTISPIRDALGKVIGVSKIARDISERKRTERILIENRLMLSMAMQSSRMGAWERDVSTGIITWTDEFETILGLKKDEFRGTEEHFYQLIFEDDRDAAFHEVELAVREHRPYSIEFRLYRADGSIRWIEGRGEAVYSERGEPVRLYGIVIDITDRKESELALARSEANLHNFLENASVAIHWVDANGIILWANKAELEMLGYSADEYIGRPVRDFHVDEPVIEDILNKLSCGETLYEYEARLRHRDGSDRYGLINSNVYWEDGKFIHTRCFTRDITERKIAEQKIREGEERFRLALSSGAVTVYEQDLDLRYEWLYPTALYSPEVLGKTDLELAPGEQGKTLTALKQKVLGSGQQLREEVWAEVLGVMTWYDLTIEPRFNDNGEIIGVGGTALDITSRKQAENELNRQALLLEGSLEPVIVWKLGGTIIDWNKGAERLYGYTAEEAIGQVTHELLKTVFPRSFGDMVDEFKSNGSWFGELRHTLKSGDEIIVESRHQLVNFNGQPLVLEANRDVTEKRRVADELKRSEARLQAMFDSTTVGFAVLDLDRRFLQINDAFCKITGYAREELLEMGRDLLDYSDDIASIEAGIDSLIIGNTSHFTLESRYVRKDRSTVWVQNSMSLTRDESDRPLHLIAIIQDITARKQAEDALEMLSRLPTENPHPVMRLSPDGILLYSNPAAQPLLDSWTEQGDMVSPILLELARRSFESGERREVELDHDDRVFHMTLAPITELGYINVYGTDVTAARTALTALQESEQRFSRFMQQLPGLAWIKDINGRYIYANESAERSFGISVEKLFGRNDDEIFAPDSAKQFKEHDRLALESGTGRQFLETLVEKDGRLHYSIVSKFPIFDASGKPALIGGMAIDVTDQKLAEEELRSRVAFDEAVVTGMGEGLLTTDAQGRVTSLNPAAERLFGWSFEEVRGKCLHEFAHYKHHNGSAFPVEDCRLLGVLKTQEALINEEDVFIHRDGTFFDVLFSASPLPTADRSAGVVVVFQDISERKRAEEQLERYRHLSEHANDIIWLLKEDGTIVEVNQAAVMAYGYSRDELIGMNVADLRHPSCFEELQGQLTSALAGNIHFETVHKKRDGSPIPVEVNASSAEFNGERLVMSILRDITDRKRQELDHEFLLRLAELIRVEPEPEPLLQSATMMLGVHLGLDRCFFSTIDLENRTSTIVSEYAAGRLEPLDRIARFDDYSQPNRQAAFAGQTIVVLDTKEDPRTAQKYDISYGPENIRSYIAVPQAREGRWSGIFFACRSKSHEWSEAEVSLVQTVSERVWLGAEKLRSEAALRETERRAMEEYQRLLERIIPLAESLGAARELNTIYRSLHGFISQSMECSGFFVSFYDSAENVRIPAFIWGEGQEIDISSLPAMPVDAKGGPNSRAILSKETVITDDYWEHQRKRQHVVLAENGIDPMSSLVVPMIVQDRVIGTLEVQAHSNNAYAREHAIALEMVANLAAVAIDNVRLIETEARARAEAETANRMKDEFLSVLSHELRTPLNAMLGWVRILRAGNVDEQRMLKALEIIERNTRQQSSLIEDLLDVSRIISGKMRIETEMIDLLLSLEQAAESVRPIAAAKGVGFDVSSAREPLYLKGDAVRLQQVFTNLLQNAVKFTSAGGRVDFNWERTASEVIIEVTDTGIGIEKDFLPMIFDRFSQADASTRRHNTGLGLGLTIVRTIVEMHGGRTVVHSDGPGKGAKFVVHLPIAVEFYREEPALAPTMANGHSSSLDGVRILIVDDDEDGLVPLRLLLEKENAAVTCVASAVGALERLAADDFHILISDIGMPKMDGYELISHVRAVGGRNQNIKAIAYTAYASEDDRRRVLASGYHAHLTKPLDMDELLLIVRDLGASMRLNRNGN